MIIFYRGPQTHRFQVFHAVPGIKTIWSKSHRSHSPGTRNRNVQQWKRPEHNPLLLVLYLSSLVVDVPAVLVLLWMQFYHRWCFLLWVVLSCYCVCLSCTSLSVSFSAPLRVNTVTYVVCHFTKVFLLGFLQCVHPTNYSCLHPSHGSTFLMSSSTCWNE